jgi:hypothetical protein
MLASGHQGGPALRTYAADTGTRPRRVLPSLPRYRTREEMTAWRARDPVVRYRNWLVLSGWWDESREQELRQRTRQQVSGSGAVSHTEAADSRATGRHAPLRCGHQHLCFCTWNALVWHR